jgi:hypothetical protein
VQNNLYVGNSVSPGANTAAPIYVQQSDLSSFTLIDHNVYSVGKILSYAQGGVNYVWPIWSDARGYKTPAEWNGMSQVGTDTFSSVSISGTSYAPSTSSPVASAGAAVAGVFTDFYGNTRAIASSGISVGAVEV